MSTSPLAGLPLKVGGGAGPPQAGVKTLILDAAGTPKLLGSDGSTASVGGGSTADILARAQALLGNDNTIVKVFGTDFDTTGWIAAPTNANGGTSLLSATIRGGVLEMKTNAAGNGSSFVRPLGLAGLIINPTTEKWYARSRSQWATAIDAGTYNTTGMVGVASNIGIFIGAIGTRSTTNFSYEVYNNAGALAANAVTSLALDTNPHVVEYTGDTSNIKIYFDFAPTPVATIPIPASFTNPCNMRLDVLTVAATNRQVNHDDYAICTAG